MFGGVLAHQEWRLGKVDPMNRGENLAALPRHHAPRRRVTLVAHDPRAERLSGDVFRDVAFTQAVRGLQNRDHARRRSAHARGRYHQARLLRGSCLRHDSRDGIESLAAELNDELPTRSNCVGVARTK